MNNLSSFPFYGGYSPNGIDTVPKGKYNYAMMTYINYLTPAYGGWRGGVRWKMNASVFTNGPTGLPSLGDITVARVPHRSAGYSASEMPLGASDSFDKSMLIVKDNSTLSGAVSTHYNVCPTLEWENPFAMNNRFIPARKSNFITNQNGPYDVYHQHVVMSYGKTGDSTVCNKFYVAGAEDYSLFFYIGPPLMYNNVPVPF